MDAEDSPADNIRLLEGVGQMLELHENGALVLKKRLLAQYQELLGETFLSKTEGTARGPAVGHTVSEEKARIEKLKALYRKLYDKLGGGAESTGREGTSELEKKHIELLESIGSWSPGDIVDILEYQAPLARSEGASDRLERAAETLGHEATGSEGKKWVAFVAKIKKAADFLKKPDTDGSSAVGQAFKGNAGLRTRLSRVLRDWVKSWKRDVEEPSGASDGELAKEWGNREKSLAGQVGLLKAVITGASLKPASPREGTPTGPPREEQDGARKAWQDLSRAVVGFATGLTASLKKPSSRAHAVVNDCAKSIEALDTEFRDAARQLKHNLAWTARSVEKDGLEFVLAKDENGSAGGERGEKASRARLLKVEYRIRDGGKNTGAGTNTVDVQLSNEVEDKDVVYLMPGADVLLEYEISYTDRTDRGKKSLIVIVRPRVPGRGGEVKASLPARVFEKRRYVYDGIEMQDTAFWVEAQPWTVSRFVERFFDYRKDHGTELANEKTMARFSALWEKTEIKTPAKSALKATREDVLKCIDDAKKDAPYRCAKKTDLEGIKSFFSPGLPSDDKVVKVLLRSGKDFSFDVKGCTSFLLETGERVSKDGDAGSAGQDSGIVTVIELKRRSASP